MMRWKAAKTGGLLWAMLAVMPTFAQNANMSGFAGPIAIIPIDSKAQETGVKITGALEVTEGKAVIAASGSITAGSETMQVTLPRRGTLRVCASTTVKLTSDTSAPHGEVPGLLMAMERGAIEASFATGRNADVLLTPDFRIMISGPGAVEVKVRLGEHGDTCVDNPGANAPYVLVTSVFGTGAYRVQPGQRVLFQHGSLQEVVDQEKEPCGCPPPVHPGTNEFPVAQSMGLAPTPAPAPSQPSSKRQLIEPLTYNSDSHITEQAPPIEQVSAPPPSVASPAQAPTPVPRKSGGFFSSVGHFFKKLFGAE